MTTSTRAVSSANVKLFLRLAADINERLRSSLRYRGDFSRFVEEALTTTDLMRVSLVPGLSIGNAKGTTASVTLRTREHLGSAATSRGCSVNSLANSALAAWLRAINWHC